MATSRSTDMGDYVLVETGEPSVTDPSVWYSRDMQWKAGTPQATLATLQQKAQAALANNATFQAIGSPTNAQNAAQVQALTRQCNGIIRLLLGALDSTTGT